MIVFKYPKILENIYLHSNHFHAEISRSLPCHFSNFSIKFCSIQIYLIILLHIQHHFFFFLRECFNYISGESNKRHQSVLIWFEREFKEMFSHFADKRKSFARHFFSTADSIPNLLFVTAQSDEYAIAMRDYFNRSWSRFTALGVFEPRRLSQKVRIECEDAHVLWCVRKAKIKVAQSYWQFKSKHWQAGFARAKSDALTITPSQAGLFIC